MNKLTKLFCNCLTAAVFALLGCNNEKSEIPTFLSLKNAEIEFVPGTGSIKQNIEDYWLYVGNDLLGVFSPGQLAPVIGEGTKDLAIQPGVRTNGFRDNADIYPFLEAYRSSVDLCSCGNILDIQPVFKYKPTAKFSFIEDFESNNIFVEDIDMDPLTVSTIQNDTVYEGEYSLLLNTNATNRINQTSSTLFYSDIPTNGTDVYLEFNYKSNLNFSVGLEAIIDGKKEKEVPYGIYNSSGWKKMYIKLNDLILASVATGGYRIIFEQIHPGASFSEPGRLYLDNIKLVHY